MSIRADILTKLADALAELYYDQGRIQAMAVTTGLTLKQIALYPRAIDTWVLLIHEAEAQGRTQVLLDRAVGQYPVENRLGAASQAYAEWVTAGQPMAQPMYARRGSLRAPPPPDTFAGRTVELQNLSEVLLRTTTAAISAAVPGMGGVGKTTLAIKLASDLAPHFPGGVVWLEAGYGAGQTDLVDRLARTLGIDLANEPLVEKRAGILQSILASRGRLMVILDDLWDIDVGRWAGKVLLPADRVLLVTSRDVALCRALCNHVQRLDVLPEAEALELLSNLLGPLGRHEDAAKELVKLLDGHPLALEIAARRCDNGAEDLPWVVRKLHAGPTLGELKLLGRENRESSVEVSLALSYGNLSPDLQQRFRALGVFAPTPFDLAGLAAVWDVETHDEAEEIARQLIRRALLASETMDDESLYRQHMLLHAYALAILEQVDELETVASRHVNYYQALPGPQAENWQAADVFWDQIGQGWQHARHAGPDAALSFYDIVRVFLERRARHTAHIKWLSVLLRLPVVKIDDIHRGALLTNMATAHYATGHIRRALMLLKRALSITQEVGDRAGEAKILNNIGNIYQTTGHPQRALTLFKQALSILQEMGDRAGETTVINNIGNIYQATGHPQRALVLFKQALSIQREIRDQAMEATTLNNMAGVYYTAGQPQRALALFEQALPIMLEMGNRAGAAGIINNMGQLYLATGQPQQALTYFEQVLPITQEMGNRAMEATVLNNIAGVYHTTGQLQRALTLFEQALPITQEVKDKVGEARALNNIGSVYDDLGKKSQALEIYEEALLIFRQIGDKTGEATTLTNIGRVYDDLGKKQQALVYYEQALLLNRQVGNRWGESITRYNIAMVYKSLDRFEEAEAQLIEVVALDEATGHPDLESDRAALEEIRTARRAQTLNS